MTLQEIKNYLRIEHDEEDAYLENLIEESLVYIDSCTGEGYKNDPKGIKLCNILQKKLIADLYENRGITIQMQKFSYDNITKTILSKLALMGEEVI
jgi:uncharacterized phage protein (predicted DNA packaging)